MIVRPLLVAAGAWLGLSLVSTAHAYCRTHTMDPAASSCPEVCTERGEPLAWRTRTITYTFNEQGFPDLDDAELRTIIGSSFRTWQNVRCDGTPIYLDIRAATATTPLESEAEGNTAAQNTNVIVHFDEDQWAEEGLPSRAFAITAVWFNENNGEIVGADMMFNGAMGPFGACSTEGCASSSGPRTDLQNVATHEFGHFLGLSHSAVPNSTMWCDAEASEVSKRSLSSDDVEGVCEIYDEPPSVLDDEEATTGCRLASGGTGSYTGLLMTLMSVLALLWRRRRLARNIGAFATNPATCTRVSADPALPARPPVRRRGHPRA